MRRIKDKIEVTVTNADYATSAGSATKATNADSATKATTADKLGTSTGSATQPVYFKDGKPVVIGYTIAKSVPADAKFTDTNTTYSNMGGASTSSAGKSGLVPAPAAGAANRYLRSDGTWQVPPDTNTWRGIQNSLTSNSTTDSLSAAQGKELKTLVDGKADKNHSHPYLPLSGGTMAGFINFTEDTKGLHWKVKNGDDYEIRPYYPNSLFQLVRTPSGGTSYGAFNIYGDGSIDLNAVGQILKITAGNVDHTFQADGLHTNLKGNADTALKLCANGQTTLPMTFNWSGKDGQPTWLWGGDNWDNMFVYNPSNFNVRHASSTSKLDGFDGQTSAQTWGVQAGTFVHGEDVDSGSFAFRKNCPASGQLSMVIDGKYYQNEGNYPCVDTSGADMTGCLNFGQSNTGLSWTCANGDIYNFRAYSPNNIFQLTRQNPSSKIGEYGVLNITGGGDIFFSQPGHTDALPMFGTVACGPNYIRFGDGTQICWGAITYNYQSASEISFPVPFVNTSYAVSGFLSVHSGVEKIIRFGNKSTSSFRITIQNGISSQLDWMAIGRWC